MCYVIRNVPSTAFVRFALMIVTEYSIDRMSDIPHTLCAMMSSADLLHLLKERGIKQARIAEVLNVAPSRVSEMYKSARNIKLDEAKRLVDAFNLEVPLPPAPMSEPIARLLVLHAAQELGVQLDVSDPRVSELAKDFVAFSRLLADPRAKQSEEAVEGFFHALLLSRDRSA